MLVDSWYRRSDKITAQQTQGVWFYGEDFREATDVRRRAGGPT